MRFKDNFQYRAETVDSIGEGLLKRVENTNSDRGVLEDAEERIDCLAVIVSTLANALARHMSPEELRAMANALEFCVVSDEEKS